MILINCQEMDFISLHGFDCIYVEFGGHVYQQTVGIPMGTNCAPLVAEFFLNSYEADFVQHLQKSKFKKQHVMANTGPVPAADG